MAYITLPCATALACDVSVTVTVGNVVFNCSSADKVERVAQTCFDSLISDLSSLLPSGVHVNRMGLINRLNKGLLNVIRDKTVDKDSMHPYVCSEVTSRLLFYAY
jgi:hypothetical protein